MNKYLAVYYRVFFFGLRIVSVSIFIMVALIAFFVVRDFLIGGGLYGIDSVILIVLFLVFASLMWWVGGLGKVILGQGSARKAGRDPSV